MEFFVDRPLLISEVEIAYAAFCRSYRAHDNATSVTARVGARGGVTEGGVSEGGGTCAQKMRTQSMRTCA